MTQKEKRSIVVLAVFMAVGLILFCVIALLSKGGERVVITRAGEELYNSPLSSDIELDYGTNTVVIKNGRVYVSKADCRDKICKNHKPISKTGETIVCLPNRIIVEIK